MMRSCRYHKTCVVCFAIGLILMSKISIAQCVVPIGPPPPSEYFMTGAASSGSDPRWTIALDSINGEYKPATLMTGLSSAYYTQTSSRWISFSESGEHNSNRFMFYKIEFDLPCLNECGKTFADDYTYCLNLDLFVDNSVYDIYVNGKSVAASSGLPVFADPFNPGTTPSDKMTVGLCTGWKGGKNELIIQVATSATVLGLLVQPSIYPPLPPNGTKLSASVCEGSSYVFGGKTLTQSGDYVEVLKTASGCDSVVALSLAVIEKRFTTIERTICEGTDYDGYTKSGKYVDHFTSSLGCDSIRVLTLIVNLTPKPSLANSLKLCIGDSIMITPGAFDDYAWSTGDRSRSVWIKQPGVYSVTVSNQCGTATANTRVTDGICGIFFPTAFTPNGDGINERFHVVTDKMISAFKLEVFNRWGQKVFATEDPRAGWDGTNRGVPQSSDLFIWQCRYMVNGTEYHQKGYVTLVR
jgi:gliding motility-associated-like protein